jgi:hypothetical protein
MVTFTIAESLSAHLVSNRPHKLPITLTSHTVTEWGGGGTHENCYVMHTFP